MHEWREAGTTHTGRLVHFGSLSQGIIMGPLRLFAERILPHVRNP